MRRPAAAPQPTARALLFESWPGRLFLAAAALKFLFAVWRALGDLPAAARVVSGVATIALGVAVIVFGWRLFVQVRRRLLWRVRRKLILSYIFIGVIPALLILVFFLFAGSLVFMNVSAYLFRDAYDKVMEDARVSAQAAATAIVRTPGSIDETIQRVHAIRMSTYPAISVAYVAPDGRTWAAGPWRPLPLPRSVPPWLAARDLFQGSIGAPATGTPGEEDLIVRTLVKVGPGGTGGAVVVDIPLDEQVLYQLYAGTGVRLENVFDSRSSLSAVPVRSGSGQGSRSVLFEKSLTQVDVTDWTTGATHRDTLALAYRLRDLYVHLSSAQAMQFGQTAVRLSDMLLIVLVVIGVLFLIIEAAALTMGLALARSITS
jgi:sigma-B regulation protein RsbU (phosphoserine phosphatase)